MKCNVCQTDNDEYARFCRHCGHELAQPAPGAPAPPAPPPPTGADPLWAQTVGTDPGGPSWTEPVPVEPIHADGLPSQRNADPQPTPTTQNQALPTITDGAVVRPVDFATAQSELRMTVAAELAARRRRKRAALISIAAVFVLIGAAVAIALAVGGDDDGSVTSATTELAVETTTSVLPETTAAPPTIVATTVAPVAATVVATTVVATTVTPTTISPTTISPTTVPLPTVTVTSPVTTPVTSPVTTPPTATTAASATTVVPTTTPAPSTSVVGANGDLGLDKPITKPACDGKYITLVGSSVDPDGYALQIGNVLKQYPAANYLRTGLVCSSLRAESAAGDPIYVVYFGPFSSKEQACRARDDGPDGAYVKVLDNTSNPGAGVNCGG